MGQRAFARPSFGTDVVGRGNTAGLVRFRTIDNSASE